MGSRSSNTEASRAAIDRYQCRRALVQGGGEGREWRGPDKPRARIPNGICSFPLSPRRSLKSAQEGIFQLHTIGVGLTVEEELPFTGQRGTIGHRGGRWATSTLSLDLHIR